MKILFLALLAFIVSRATETQSFEHECFTLTHDEDINGYTFVAGREICCGYTANGKRRCDYKEQCTPRDGGKGKFCSTRTIESACNQRGGCLWSGNTCKQCTELSVGECGNVKGCRVENNRCTDCYSYGDRNSCNSNGDCSWQTKWTKYQGKDRLCVKGWNPTKAVEEEVDICCDNNYVENCAVCPSFHVWDFADDLDLRDRSYMETDWRNTYYDLESTNQPLIYPGGFVNGILRDQNLPVCVYVRRSGGHVLEIKVEPEEDSSSVCIGDLHDDNTDKGSAGFATTCGSGRLTTCVHDGTLKNDDIGQARGFTFQMVCMEGCNEQADVTLWFRARFSTLGYQDNEETTALDATEMFCEYVNRDFPEFDIFPTDIEFISPDYKENEDTSGSFMLSVTFLVALVSIYVL